jgi:ubiquinone/menaquinone biosynthesis C-methylase UbiE
MDLFAGTADYYDRFRPGVPSELVTRVVAEAGRFSLAHSLLDIGTGTGKVLEQFLPYFKDIIAVEPDSDMLEHAKHRLISQMSAEASIFFLDGSIEIVQFPPNWSASLVTICRAFHWLDQPTALERLDSILEARGIIAIIGDQSFWTLDNPWTSQVRAIVQQFLGETRRAGNSIYNEPAGDITEVLQQSAFSHVESFVIPVTRTWTAQQILGYLYSTSFAAPGLFEDKREDFERVLLDKLHRMMPNNKFIEENQFEVILARRPFN